MKRRDFLTAAGSISAASALTPFYSAAAKTPCPPPTLFPDGGTTVTSSCAGTLPSYDYLNTMTAFQVRQLSGTYAPTNGKTTIQEATPAEWLNRDPGLSGLRSVTGKWSGGVGDPGTGKLYMLGGGHNDSANNGLYVYDFSGNLAPTGFTVASQSAVSSVIAGTNIKQYSDGNISARHTYDGIAFINSKVYVFGGANWSTNGNFANDYWKFENGVWSLLGAMPDSGERSSCIADPVSGKILHWIVGHGTASFLNTATNTWGAAKNVGSGTTDYTSLCLDTTRNRVVSIGGGINRLWTVNWSTETISQSTFPQSSILNTPAITPVYDALRDRFWILGGNGGSLGYTNLYEMHPTTFAIIAHPLTGDLIPDPDTDGDSTGLGSYKRGLLINSQAIGFVSNTIAPPIVIKLP